MPKQIVKDTLLETLKDPNGFIRNGDPRCVEDIKYDLRFGGRFLKAKHGRFLDISTFAPTNVEDTRIEPGETVFVITQEEIILPKDMKAELSLKRKLAHDGILILGGFCVDPNYEGPLIFGLYNFSANAFNLEKGKKLIAAQFYRLLPEECGDYGKPKSADDLLDDVTKLVARFTGNSKEVLSRKVEQLSAAVEAMRAEIKGQNEWFNKFQDSIDKIREPLGQLERALEKEVTERRATQSDFRLLIAAHENNLKQLNEIAVEQKAATSLAKWVISLILIPIAVGLLIAFILYMSK